MNNRWQHKIQKYSLILMKPFLVLFIVAILVVVLNSAYVLYSGIPATSWLAVYPPITQQFLLWCTIIGGLVAIGFIIRQIKNTNLKDILEAIEEEQKK